MPAALLAAALSICPIVAFAAEIRILSAGAMSQPLKELLPRFEQATGDKISIVFGNAGAVRGLLEKGEAADLVILPADGLADVEAKGFVQPGTRADLAAISIGVAVRKGVPPPDISTPDALRRALVEAKAVAYSDPARATSGKHFDSVVLPALGIADEVRAKAKLQAEGSSAEFVRRGEADIAVQQVSELLSVEGVTVIGLLPASLQKTTIYSAIIATRATARQSAEKLIAFLTSAPSKAVFRAKGMEPS